MWFSKRRKKAIKPRAPKTIIALMLLTSTIAICLAQKRDFLISGEIITTTKNKGPIIVFLVNEDVSKSKMTGIDTVVVTPKAKLAYFKFEPKKMGIYGIRCFHDINNNGILDKRIFKPIKPYGFSWKSGKKLPFDFSDISFVATENIFISIIMED